MSQTGAGYPGNANMPTELDRLRAQCAELAADAERYRFLRADFSPMGLNMDGQHAWAYRRNATLKGPTLDAAIDAALARHKEGAA